MPTDSISTWSYTSYMSHMDGGSKFEVAVSLNHDIMTSNFDSTSDIEPTNFGQLVWIAITV